MEKDLNQFKSEGGNEKDEKGHGRRSFFIFLEKQYAQDEKFGNVQKIGKKYLVQEDFALEKKIKNDRGCKQNGGIVQRFARSDRLEKCHDEERR